MCVCIMKKSGNKDAAKHKETKAEIEKKLTYPPKEDIYNQGQKEGDIDPDDLTQKKAPNEKPDLDEPLNEKDFEDDVSGGDLDVPGSELDDEEEKNGSEDEENNYYSLGDTK